MESRVNFTVIGTQKGGTQALNQFLKAHPEIGMVTPPVIAPHFFDNEKIFSDIPDYEVYHRMYSEKSLAMLTGDVTPIYSYWPNAVARIKAYNPDMKIIFLLRDPVLRTYSHWNMEYSRGDEKLGFLKAILTENRRRAGGAHRIYSYLHRSLYAPQVVNLLEYFERKQCLFIKSDELQRSHVEVMSRIFSFLDVDSTIIPEQQSVHARHYPQMPSWLNFTLRLYFQRDIVSVEQLTGLDLKAWRLI
ncbi:deacetylase sulfotransferase [Arenicella chitinivorans]|uniref:Deacetylase sulfotransferase n=1 Tax=Arenicella chitinivorans TaxID=1329800 RepID=A0A918VJD7_9GAMM|nr:sulfotransferase domain-containing protein [Arenicella chitinivorans]GHA00676.1 deacetylase sulfotransferase [Arenicella chitinivorans]